MTQLITAWRLEDALSVNIRTLHHYGCLFLRRSQLMSEDNFKGISSSPTSSSWFLFGTINWICVLACNIRFTCVSFYVYFDIITLMRAFSLLLLPPNILHLPSFGCHKHSTTILSTLWNLLLSFTRKDYGEYTTTYKKKHTHTYKKKKKAKHDLKVVDQLLSHSFFFSDTRCEKWTRIILIIYFDSPTKSRKLSIAPSQLSGCGNGQWQALRYSRLRDVIKP